MPRGKMAWTEAMTELLEDNEWHDAEDVLATGSRLVPDHRADDEIGRRPQLGGRDKPSEDDAEQLARRRRMGARNVAQQALMGMRRFGHAEYSKDRESGRTFVRKASAQAVNPGRLAERVRALEEEMDALRPGWRPEDAESA